MKIGIPKEIFPGETRVALTPGMVATLLRGKHEVLVEAQAGLAAGFTDTDYAAAGARIADTAKQVFDQAEVIFKVQPPREELFMLRQGSTYIGFFAPLSHRDIVRAFVEKKITSFSMEYVPRITRAQSMDALSSMATLAGYKAVLLAASKLGKIFPLMMTAAGTLPPATVLVLGAGVAGLQAIATAKRLGAKVEAFDSRPAVREQVKSLGAMFVEMEMPKDAETAGGYAKELSLEFIRKEMEAIASRLPKVSAVVSTAQVFGKRAPVLIDDAMVKMMKPGSVIVDLAAEQGGNCSLTQAGKTIEAHGVHIIGAVNLPATLPTDASSMYAKNITTLFAHIFEKSTIDFTDDIVKGACITRQGEIVHEAVRAALEKGDA